MTIAAAPTAAGKHWHRAAKGGSLRAAVFGVNDRLVSNLSLVMGVAGADPPDRFIVLAGVAGLLAGAFSMAAGEYVSVRTQRERFQHHLAREADELARAPHEERAELVAIYQRKGLDRPESEAIADQLMVDPDIVLETMAREELGLDPDDLGSPWVAAGSSFVTFAAGAALPVLPFLLATGRTALVLSAVLSAVALLLVGAGLSLLTGRKPLRSGLRMLAIGATAAAVTFAVGSLIGVSAEQ